MLIHPWPIDVLTPKHPGFWPDGGVRAGPRSISGLQQLDALDGGPMWRARFVEIPVYCRQRVLAAQAIQALAQNGVGLFDVPRVPSVRQAAYPAAYDGGLDGVPHSDGSPFSDGSLYGSGVNGEIVGAVALYDAVIVIKIDVLDAQLLGGEEFGINHPDVGPRMYRIQRVLEETSGEITVEIMPPMRADVADGALLNFSRPSCVMRMTNAPAFLQMLEWNRWADLTAEFEEAWW